MAREFEIARKSLLGTQFRRLSTPRKWKKNQSLVSTKLIFLGPPGAGEGTLAALVGKEYDIPHISTGDLFREAINQETKLGLEVKEVVEKGGLVPDEITIDIILNRLAQPDARTGYILDGFPRTIEQAVVFERLESVDAVVRLVPKISEAGGIVGISSLLQSSWINVASDAGVGEGFPRSRSAGDGHTGSSRGAGASNWDTKADLSPQIDSQ